MGSRPGGHKKGEGLGSSPSHDGFQIAGRLWVAKDGETFLAWGRVMLLERIREHGSISAAARSMKMGYRHAWTLVEEMNRLSPRPLVAKAVGGTRGGGSALTAEGETVVRRFWELVEDYKTWISKQDPRLWDPES